MKLMPLLIATMSLAACSSGGVVKIKQPSDATGLMLTQANAEAVARCMGQLLGTQPTQSSEGYLINSAAEPTVSYRVAAIGDPLNRYQTRVDVLGQRLSEAAPYAASCLHPGAIES